MKTVYVKEISMFAAFDEEGKKLRKIIEEHIETNPNDVMILDFIDVQMFSTMFFNASIGYIVMKRGKEFLEQHIKCVNLSPVGQSTYEHSIQNALLVRDNASYPEILSKLDPCEE